MQDKEDEIDENFFSNFKKSRKTAKEDILDVTFKKAEMSKGLKTKSDKKKAKKPFLKLGIFLIAIAIIVLIIINFLPWIIIKYDSRYGEVQESYYINFDNNEGHYFNETNYIFESPCTNCSNYSSNFIGLTKDDFTNISNSVKLAFYGLIILGVIFTIFEVIEKWRNLNSDLVILIHSTFAVVSDIISIYVAYLCIKFIGSYFLLFYNTQFIEASGVNNIVVIYPVVIILLLISFIIMVIATAVMQVNFHEFEKRLFSETTHSALNAFNYGRKT
jgi:hypothetical protein